MPYQVRRYDHGSRVPGWDRAVDLAKDPAQVPDPATTPVPAELRAEIEAAMAKYPDFRSATLPALAAAQRYHGWLSPEALCQVACVMRLTPANMAGVASFYDMFDLEPAGRHRVYVCTNISCSLRGADELCHAIEQATADEPDIQVRHFECLGACDIAPMASVDGVYVGPIELGEVDELIDDIRNERPPLPRKQLKARPTAEAIPLEPERATPAPPTSYGEDGA
jgi:NADH:ubiquinone oxidoreductase subunit E